MKHYESSLRTNSTVDQAHDSITKLHNAITQALSHPNEQTIAQAEQSLDHAIEAYGHAPEGSIGGQGVDLVEERLNEEKERLAALREQTGGSAE
ncbi:hypothetical protein [Paenibacillus tengchongensis]|uniref:hypothetical protein n=1 Tax=Paenibacillus tengchongensis TaxID=2608684 RepID=UPI00124C9744|nr:hypothetical protein [Paenibacillus tengchongensis]